VVHPALDPVAPGSRSGWNLARPRMRSKS